MRYSAEVRLQTVWTETCNYVVDRLGKSLEYGSKGRDPGSDNIKKCQPCPFECQGDDDIQVGSVIQWQFPGIETENCFLLYDS